MDLSPLANELKAIFESLLRRKVRVLQYYRVRGPQRNFGGFDEYPGIAWPTADNGAVHKALLTLHQAHFILYGANSVKLYDTML